MSQVNMDTVVLQQSCLLIGINLFLYTASKHLRRKIWLLTYPHSPETYFDPLSQKLWRAKRKDYMIMRGKPSNLGPMCCYCLLA